MAGKRTHCSECGSKFERYDGGCPVCLNCGYSPC